MTQSKREPFSVILLEYSDAGGQTYSVEVFGTKIAGNFGLDGSNRKCAELNAAFNARVDEEVKVALAHQEMDLFSEKKIYESIEKAVSRAVAERDARIKGLEAEILESARLHGMGSQREAALEARIAELEKALEPFAHPGLSEVLSGICMGDDSTVFQWNKATLLVRHFKKARKALGKGE